MTPEAKSALSKTIRQLRARLIRDLTTATRRRYRLHLRQHEAGLDERRHGERERLEQWLGEQERASRGAGEARDREDFLRELVKEAAYTLLHRVVLLRLMEEAELSSPPIVKGGWDSRGYREFTEWAPALVDDATEGYRLLLELVFDELAHDLPGLFGEVGLTELVPVPPAAMRELVEQLDKPELTPCWSDDTTFGWTYQFWNDPEREELDAKLKSGGKIEPHEIASKTQLFTERYMVEWLLQNSLGPTWLAICQENGWTPEARSHGVLDALDERREDWRRKRQAGDVALDDIMPIRSDLEERWKYYVQRQADADAAPEGDSVDSVRALKLLDPACGSGHFLVIAFELLWAMYHEEARHRGEEWSPEQIVHWILTCNLHGIDIDPRAVQIAAAALYLKARSLVSDISLRKIQVVSPKGTPLFSRLRLASLRLASSDVWISNLEEGDTSRQAFCGLVFAEIGLAHEVTNQILTGLRDAYYVGSLLKIDETIYEALEEWGDEQLDIFEQAVPAEPIDQIFAELKEQLWEFLEANSSSDDLGLRLHTEQLAAGVRFLELNRVDEYDLVATNPPYCGSSNLSHTDHLKKDYPEGKADLYAAFLMRGLQFVREGGLSAMVTMRNWMFIKTYEQLRAHLLESHDLRALADLHFGAFDEMKDVSAAMCVARRSSQNASNAKTSFVRPVDPDEVVRDVKQSTRNRSGLTAPYALHQRDVGQLVEIEGQPLVYWWGRQFLRRYLDTAKLGVTHAAQAGMATQDNTRFLRLAWEIPATNSFEAAADEPSHQGRCWVPYIKGGAGREWIEPLRDVVNWKAAGIEISSNAQARYGSVSRVVQSASKYFSRGIAFAPIGNAFSARMHRFRGIISNMGSSVFPPEPELANVLCLMNSSTARQILSSLNPGVHFEVRDVNRLPLFSVSSAEEIVAQLDRAFTEHEAARETSVEFKKPGSSCWEYAQAWAQKAVDRPEGERLPSYEPEHEDAPPENWLSWAVGVALGRFDEEGEQGWLDEAPEDALPSGILYVTATDCDDSLTHPATNLLHQMWDKHGEDVGRNKDDLNSWLRVKFFKSVHRQMYDNAPIYFPLSSEQKTFVAHVNIHRWDEHTLTKLLADHLVPERNRLQGMLADLNKARASDEDDTRRRAEDKYADVNAWLEELEQFISDVEQCAEKGPPSTGKKCPEREVDARYAPDLDDGTMINAAALWPLLDPQWRKYPKKWWKRLANEKGYRGKHFDWSKLAARYWPTRVDEKCQEYPSLAVAHGTFWKYHPERAYEWELRLQDEIHPNFTIDEDGSDDARQAFFDAHPDKVEDIRADEYKRRERNADGEADILPVVAPEEHPTSEDVVPEVKDDGATTRSEQTEGVPAE